MRFGNWPSVRYVALVCDNSACPGKWDSRRAFAAKALAGDPSDDAAVVEAISKGWLVNFAAHTAFCPTCATTLGVKS